MRPLLAMIIVCLAVLTAIPSSSLGEKDIITEFDYANVGKEAQGLGAAGADNYRLYIDARTQQQRTKFYECLVIAAVAIVSLLIVLTYIVRSNTFTASHIVNASALVFIIFGTILLSLFSETEQQLTAAIGILGAVAGYIFGTLRRSNGQKDEGQ